MYSGRQNVETCVRTKTYAANPGLKQTVKYHVFHSSPNPTKRERDRNRLKQSRAPYNSSRTAADYLNNNFNARKSSFITLTFAKEAYDKLCNRAGVRQDKKQLNKAERDKLKEEAHKELDNFVRRTRRKFPDFKYFAVVSDMDGKTGKAKRIHIHMVIETAALPACEKAWGKRGRIEAKPIISNHGDMTSLAKYMINQTREPEGKARYTHSKNLRMPEISYPRKVSRNADSELSVPPGALLLSRPEYIRGIGNQSIMFLTAEGRKRWEQEERLSRSQNIKKEPLPMWTH